MCIRDSVDLGEGDPLGALRALEDVHAGKLGAAGEEDIEALEVIRELVAAVVEPRDLAEEVLHRRGGLGEFDRAGARILNLLEQVGLVGLNAGQGAGDRVQLGVKELAPLFLALSGTVVLGAVEKNM